MHFEFYTLSSLSVAGTAGNYVAVRVASEPLRRKRQTKGAGNRTLTYRSAQRGLSAANA